MSESGGNRRGSGARGNYFYLSYAHSPPLAGSLLEDTRAVPDRRVGEFFRDLTQALQRHASRQSSLQAGFFDQEILFDPTWKATLTSALGSAQVFVPLYSPDYVTRSWPGREWACFEQRVRNAGVEDPLQRFVPVLWIPLPEDQRIEGLREARELAPAGAAESYVENGLLALLRLRPYRAQYDLVVDELARRIVRLAEESPIEPSAVPDIDLVESPISPRNTAPVFAVVVAAPARPDLPAGPDDPRYGRTGTDWRPFPQEQDESLAEHAVLIGEQFDFAVQVTEIEKAGTGTLSYAPGVILIDPWYTADDQGLSQFRSFVRDLPPWVLPVLVTDPDALSAQPAEQVRVLLRQAQKPRSEPARRALQGIGSLKDFTTLMPFLVAAAEREYLRHGPGQRFTVQPGSRPRLADSRKIVGSGSSPSAADEPR
jgi:FxsC-like protein